MKKFISVMMVAVAALALASCGGSGSGPLTGGQSSQGTTPPPPTKYNLTVLTSNPQMPSDDSKSPTITALVRDANNNVVNDVPVAFQASSGAVTVTQAVTGPSGTATATLSTAGDPTNRTITVTATAGASTASVSVDVIGTKLSVSGPSSMVTGDTQSYGIALVDAGNNGISGQTVQVTSAKDNTLNPSTLTTDTAGQGTFTMTAVNSGTDTLTVAAAGLKATESVAVSNDSFAITAPAANAAIDIGTPRNVTVVWKSSGSPVAGQAIHFSATRGTLSAATATTDVNGSATVTISSSSAGPAVISASGNGVSAQVIVNFLATTPSTISLQASPTTVAIQGKSTITATVRDPNGNLVANEAVDFALVKDATGGSLSAATAVTNAQGQASVVYTASSTTSQTNGVEISGTVSGTAITGNTALTVGGETVILSLGTGGGQSLITETADHTQYVLPYSVLAVDSAGNAISGVTVSFTVESLGYGKGVMVFYSGFWTPGVLNSNQTVTLGFTNDANFSADQTSGVASVIAGLEACDTEDGDNDGIEDSDYNNDFGHINPGQPVIWPGQVAVTSVGSATTDSTGSATVNLLYPKDHAYWVAVRLTATATVQGAQSSTSVDFWLPGAASDYNQSTVGPPGQTSPYGTGTSCIDSN